MSRLKIVDVARRLGRAIFRRGAAARIRRRRRDNAVSTARPGHRARSGGWWGPSFGSKGNGRRGRKSPSNRWIRVPEQSVVGQDADYQVTDLDRQEVKAGRTLFFTGGALAKAELICERQGGQEILWYWTALRSTPWVIDDLILPDDQYATSGTCYAAPEVVLTISRQVRRMGRLIMGAGHSHGRLAVFSSLTDLELMSQLAAERVGFASQVRQLAQGAVRKQTVEKTAADDADASPEAISAFEVAFDNNPELRVNLGVAADLSEEDVQVELDRIQRHQVSFFTTHNADGDHYFPVHHVTTCAHCGTRLEDYSAEDVAVHVIGPQILTEEERNDVIAELDEKAPRGGFFRERWGWSGSKTKQAVVFVEADGETENDAVATKEAGEKKPADFFLYRHGERVAKVPAVVLEEAAYRCPKLAHVLGWNKNEAGEIDAELTRETDDEAEEGQLDEGMPEEPLEEIEPQPTDEADQGPGGETGEIR